MQMTKQSRKSVVMLTSESHQTHSVRQFKYVTTSSGVQHWHVFHERRKRVIDKLRKQYVFKMYWNIFTFLRKQWMCFILWQRNSKRKESENVKYIMHRLGALDDSCFMAFPMRQDRTVCEWAVSGAAIVVQQGGGGGPPTWSQQWSKYCCMATSLSLAHSVNCGRSAERCYLSLPADLRGLLEAESAVTQALPPCRESLTLCWPHHPACETRK